MSDFESDYLKYDAECIRPLAEYVTSVGNKPLFDYSKEEILGLIKTVRSAWRVAADNDIPY